MVASDTARLRLKLLLDTLAHLRRYRSQLTVEQVTGDPDVQHMVLHALYVAAQSCIDLAMHSLADAQLPAPATYQESFRNLATSGRLPKDLADRLAGWAGLRNVLAHHYPVIDYGRVHAALANDLGDLEQFAAIVAEWIETAP